jgi:hypothetical protein
VHDALEAWLHAAAGGGPELRATIAPATIHRVVYRCSRSGLLSPASPSSSSSSCSSSPPPPLPLRKRKTVKSTNMVSLRKRKTV